MLSSMANLVKAEYAGPATDCVTRLSCGLCGHDFLSPETGPMTLDMERFSRDLVAHYKDAHGIPVEVHLCDDPGCRWTN